LLSGTEKKPHGKTVIKNREPKDARMISFLMKDIRTKKK
jgi:hypothetical protein